MSLSSGPTTAYGYYPDGSLRTIDWSPVTGPFRYQYTLRGQYQAITFPNGQARSYTYDDQGRLLQLGNTHPTAGNVATYTYGYDTDFATGAPTMKGQRVSLTADVASQGLASALTRYFYDPLYQLTRVEYPSAAPFNGEVHSWTYDAIGNRLTNTVNGTTGTYTYRKLGTNPKNWQRLIRDPSSTQDYELDDSGNLISRADGYRLSWDWASRLTGITGTITGSYVYDYQGRRATKTMGGATTSYTYEGLNPIRESGGVTTDYLFGPGVDEPLAMARSSAISYYVVDGLGSVSLITDSAGGMQSSYTYDAWGVPRSASENVPQPFRYTAREAGDVPNDWFYRARFYRPSVGRFLSEDPIGFRGGINLFTYVEDDPVNATDPTGLAKKNKNSWYGPCDQTDEAYCVQYCAPRRSLGCAVHYTRLIQRVYNQRNGTKTVYVKKRVVECDCDDPLDPPPSAPSWSAPWLFCFKVFTWVNSRNYPLPPWAINNSGGPPPPPVWQWLYQY
jgi:RHS repeat-associated protein